MVFVMSKSLLLAMFFSFSYVVYVFLSIGSGGFFDEIWVHLLNAFIPMIVYFFVRISFGDSALNSYIVLIAMSYWSFKWIFK